ncbi:HNH endonuclease [Desulfosediminicola flagellatus]|uniref:HNH endonuclease n=1 Tax=Desulfosediminicola flagellatus TaxID=2569541 RepID=UPI0010AD8326|nr:HNH endonuclease [Desulfosediminicola flagellatus]
MSDLKRKPWSRDELLLAINLYCKTPFGKIHVRNPEIIELANLLGRTPGSISYKLANFASIDQSLPRKGASNVSKLDRKVWSDFFDNWEMMSYESELALSKIQNKEIQFEMLLVIPEGRTRDTVVKARINQTFFRRTIIASYGACCITGLSIPELLVASHIVPWSKDVRNRTNPKNGLCLNPLHDKAFDVGLITIDENYKVKGSTRITNTSAEESKILTNFIGIKINLPNRFAPDQEFLSYHRENIFRV